MLNPVHPQLFFSLHVDYVSYFLLIIRSRDLNLAFQRTDADVKALLKTYLYRGATDAQVDSVADQYPQDPAAVSFVR